MHRSDRGRSSSHLGIDAKSGNCKWAKKCPAESKPGRAAGVRKDKKRLHAVEMRATVPYEGQFT